MDRVTPTILVAVLAAACSSTPPPTAKAPQTKTAHASPPGTVAPRNLEPTPLSEQALMFAEIPPSWTGKGPPANLDPEVWRWLEPKDNTIDVDRVVLGEKLYFDGRLSADGTIACATCHDVAKGFADGQKVSDGIGGQEGKRNAPTVLNAVFFERQFLDGRAASLEDQARLPIVNPIEMGQPNGAAAVANIADDREYQRMFRLAYGRAPNYDDIARAIAAFERTLVFIDAPYDRWLDGDQNAMDDAAKRGFELFNGKGRCVTCHHINGTNPLGSDQRFHNIGIAARDARFEKLAADAVQLLAHDNSAEAIDKLALETDLSPLGRFLVTKNEYDIGAFKTSQLRNVGLTAPYMHDGSLANLWDVMDHYNKGGEANPYLDGGIEPLALTDDEIDDLVAFMFALTDERFADEQQDERARQAEQARENRPEKDEALADRKVLPFEARVRGAGEK